MLHKETCSISSRVLVSVVIICVPFVDCHSMCVNPYIESPPRFEATFETSSFDQPERTLPVGMMMSCAWVITSPDGATVDVFVNVNLRPAPCVDEYIEVYTGEATNKELLHFFCGNDHYSFTSLSPSTTIEFHSTFDDYEFSVIYFTEQHIVQTTSSGWWAEFTGIFITFGVVSLLSVGFYHAVKQIKRSCGSGIHQIPRRVRVASGPHPGMQETSTIKENRGFQQLPGQTFAAYPHSYPQPSAPPLDGNYGWPVSPQRRLLSLNKPSKLWLLCLPTSARQSPSQNEDLNRDTLMKRLE